MYEPDNVHLNIVFVHGLDGHREKTWQYSAAFESFWPNWLHEKNEETVLRRNLENARIVTFGYDAGWKNITATSNVLDLTKFADGLLSSLLLLMNEAPALNIAVIDDDYKLVHQATKAIVFIGTPHRGAVLANYLAKALAITFSEKKFVPELAPNSTAIIEITRDFVKHTKHMLMKTIVTPDSAVMGLPNERSVYLNGNHLSICKFSSRSSANYHSVADAIFRLADKIVDQSGLPSGCLPGSPNLVSDSGLEVKPKCLPMFNVPYRRNPNFTGHVSTLQTIHQKLVSNARPGITSSYVIYCLGGVGKTQLAIEYLYQHRKDFEIIYWLRADDYETLLTSYSQLYEDPCFRGLTGPNLGDEDNLEKMVARVMMWFERCEDLRWLLVIDNADKLQRDSASQEHQIKTIGNIIPRGQSGCVLVTSRDRSALGQLATDGEELIVMDEDEAKEFMFKCSKADPTESESATTLVNQLGRLPLAIEQAGGFIRESGTTLGEYTRLYNANRSKALKEGLSPTHRHEYYRETVSTTWNISFDAVRQKDHLASLILQIAAFLDGKQIQKDLFYGATLRIGDSEENLSEWEINKAFGTLMSYSLVRPAQGQESVEMHLLVQTIIRGDEKTDKSLYFNCSAELVQRRFPWGDHANNLKGCRMYLSQAQHCVAIAEELQIENSIIGNILESMGSYLELVGQFKKSLVSFRRALKISEAKFGLNHINSAYTIGNIGIIYRKQGKYSEALPWYERALKIIEREFGMDHINSANTIMGIGLVYNCRGNYAEAMSWYERALKIKEREFGVDHINSASTIMNIGIVYQNQGYDAEAISSYERALKINEREFGVDHIHSADTINNIGEVYDKQGKYAEAMSWYERALKIDEREFGVDHINSASTITNIGIVYQNQGDYAEAMSWYERALKIFEREFGVDHPNSATTLHNIGMVHKQMSDFVSAKSYFERAARLHRQCLGARHEFTLGSEHELSYVNNALHNSSHSITQTNNGD